MAVSCGKKFTLLLVPVRSSFIPLPVGARAPIWRPRCKAGAGLANSTCRHPLGDLDADAIDDGVGGRRWGAVAAMRASRRQALDQPRENEVGEVGVGTETTVPLGFVSAESRAAVAPPGARAGCHGSAEGAARSPAVARGARADIVAVHG